MRCEDIASNPDFRHLSTVPAIAVDLRYAGVNNFVGRDLYGSLDCAWLHHLAAAGLERAVTLLEREAPGHRLLVLDALRPHRVQIQLWDHLAARTCASTWPTRHAAPLRVSKSGCCRTKPRGRVSCP